MAQLLAAAEEELLAFMAFPKEHWTKLRSTDPLERVNREIGCRSDVVGVYPNDAALVRLAGALLIQQNDELLVDRRYLSEESLAAVLGRRRTPPGSWRWARYGRPEAQTIQTTELHNTSGLDWGSFLHGRATSV